MYGWMICDGWSDDTQLTRTIRLTFDVVGVGDCKDGKVSMFGMRVCVL